MLTCEEFEVCCSHIHVTAYVDLCIVTITVYTFISLLFFGILLAVNQVRSKASNFDTNTPGAGST